MQLRRINIEKTQIISQCVTVVEQNKFNVQITKDPVDTL